MANFKALFLLSVMAALPIACTPQGKEDAKEVKEQVKDKAQEVAEDAKEKTKVIAEEVVDKSKQLVSATGEAINDGWITAKIKTKFADEKLLKNSEIDVDTKDRVVTLKGTVGSTPAKEQAERIAGGTEGVGRVVNQLALR